MDSNLLYVISFNNLKADFWKFHLGMDYIDAKVTKAKKFDADAMFAEQPCAIVIDSYFSAANSDRESQAILSQLQASNFNGKIFFLSPSYSLEEYKVKYLDERVECHSFDEDFIHMLKSSLILQSWGMAHS